MNRHNMWANKNSMCEPTPTRIINIYLDIDGVIVGTASPQKDIEALMEYILDHFPDTTYWLTTHCKHGENRCIEYLNGKLPGRLLDEMKISIKPAWWNELKTEGIDMDQDFVWLDDTLFESEKLVLKSYQVLDGFYKMDPKNPDMAKKALAKLKSL